MEFHEIYIYRMTHIENIPHILSYGITHKNSPNRNPNYIDIGDLQIIKTRAEKKSLSMMVIFLALQLKLL